MPEICSTEWEFIACSLAGKHSPGLWLKYPMLTIFSLLVHCFHAASIGLVGWVGGWMVGWLDGWMVGWLDGWVLGCLGGWMVGWLDGWMVGWLDRWKVGWLGGGGPSGVGWGWVRLGGVGWGWVGLGGVFGGVGIGKDTADCLAIASKAAQRPASCALQRVNRRICARVVWTPV